MRDEKTRRVLVLVHELHMMGYECLRIAPFVDDGPAPIWKCDVAPAIDISREHGAILKVEPAHPPLFSRRYMNMIDYPWPGMLRESPRQSAEQFLGLYPDLAARGLGEDAEYIRWYAEMLEQTGSEGYVAASVYWEPPPGHMYVFNVQGNVIVRIPPPGLA